MALVLVLIWLPRLIKGLFTFNMRTHLLGHFSGTRKLRPSCARQGSRKLRDGPVAEIGTRNTRTRPLHLKQSMDEKNNRTLGSSKSGGQKLSMV